MQYSEKDLASLISSVEEEFAKHLISEEEKLEKSEEETLEKSEEAEVETEVNEETLEKAEYEYDEEDISEMNELYSEMSKSEQEIHFNSLKAALGIEDLQKSEDEEEEKDDLLKSENEELKKSNEELQKNIDNLTAALGKFLDARAPKQKAVTQIQYLEKNENSDVDVENLSKTDITKKLTEKIRSGEIKKSEDKEAINAYYLDNTNIDTIKHLL